MSPKPFTKWLYKHISERATEGVFTAKGFIYFNEPMNSATATMVLSGKDNKGRDLDEEKIEFFAENCFTFEACELEKINASALPDLAPKGGKSFSGGFGGSKGQTEAERLNDRWEFVKKITGTPDAKTAYELLTGVGSTYPGFEEDILKLVSALTQV